MASASRPRRLYIGVFAALLAITVLLTLYRRPVSERWRPTKPALSEFSTSLPTSAETDSHAAVKQNSEDYGEDITVHLTQEQQDAAAKIVNAPRLELFSKITSDGRYLKVDFGGAHQGYNPSIVPHPYKKETWIVIAQKDASKDDAMYFSVQLVCEAEITGDIMRCVKPPLSLPIASTVSHHCAAFENMEQTSDMIGPHDARIFYGADRPMVSWMTQSQYTCWGQYFQDLRRLVLWDRQAYSNESEDLFWPTEVKTPVKPQGIEKNYFLFWDADGQPYAHHEIKRDHRTFAKLNMTDGTVGENLAPLSAASDAKCMARLMPEINLETKAEFIHQSTNSLLVTMCKRSDPSCTGQVDNTFVMTIFQKKSFYLHGMYEPYVMLFKQTAPFEVYGISSRSLWYNGRGRAEGDWQKGTWRPHGQTELLFTTSMSWKSHDLTYQGYLDDDLFLAFGIEDRSGGVIDVTVGDILADLAYCDR